MASRAEGIEILFRGFLFRQFRRWTDIPFWIAAVLSSFVFAYRHRYEGHTLITSLKAAGVTFVGWRSLLLVDRTLGQSVACDCHPREPRTLLHDFAIEDGAMGKVLS